MVWELITTEIKKLNPKRQRQRKELQPWRMRAGKNHKATNAHDQKSTHSIFSKNKAEPIHIPSKSPLA